MPSKPAPPNVETEPKKAAGKDKSSDRKVQTKRKRGAKGKQAEVTKPLVYPHKMEKLNTRRAQTLRKQERQKLCVVNITHRVLSVVPAYLLVQSR